MHEYTQKALKEMVVREMAEDITNADLEKYKQLVDWEDGFTQVGYSSGIYGCNGMLLQGVRTGHLYAITARTSAIYLFG